jgi:hypothetical protein
VSCIHAVRNSIPLGSTNLIPSTKGAAADPE